MWNFFFKRKIEPTLTDTGQLLAEANERLEETKIEVTKTIKIANELQTILEKNHVREKFILSITGETPK